MTRGRVSGATYERPPSIYPPIEPDHGRDAELRRLLDEFYTETWAMARDQGAPA